MNHKYIIDKYLCKFYAIISMAFILSVSGCANTSSGKAGVPVGLRSEQFVGHTFTLISETQTLIYIFEGDGEVEVTLGSKDIMTAPIFDWKIKNGKTLFITAAPEGQPNDTISYEFKSLTETNAVTTTGMRFKRD